MESTGLYIVERRKSPKKLDRKKGEVICSLQTAVWPSMPAHRRWEPLQMFNLSTGARKRANDAWFMWNTSHIVSLTCCIRQRTEDPATLGIYKLFRVAGTVEIASSWNLCEYAQWRPDRIRKTSPSAHTQKPHLAHQPFTDVNNF